MKRILMLLALSATAVLATATVAQAQVATNTTVSYGYSGWVSCANGGAGELVIGTIDMHILVTSTVNENVDAWQFMSAPRGSLIGRITGDTYQLTGVTRGTYVEILEGDRYAATYVSRYQLIGPRTGTTSLSARPRTYARRATRSSSAGDFVIECA